MSLYRFIACSQLQKVPDVTEQAYNHKPFTL